MLPSRFFSCLLFSAMTLLADQAFSISSSAESPRGDLDTVPPDPGILTAPRIGTINGIMISYSGASDFSGINQVELWFRPDTSEWADSGESSGGERGSFTFYPPDPGLFHFDLVAEDNVGNRSLEPAGSQGTGQGSTSIVSTNTSYWMLF